MMMTIKKWMEFLGYELCDGFGYEDVWGFRSLLNYSRANYAIEEALKSGIIKSKVR